MLRTKRRFVGAQLQDLFGGRYKALSGALRGSVPPVSDYSGWWDCSDVSSLTISSNKVSQWNDKSANAYHFSQGTGGNQPLYDAAPRTIAGVTVPEFDGTARFMTSSLPASARPAARFAVVLADTGGLRSILDGSSGSGGGLEWRTTSGGYGLEVVKEGVTNLFSSGPYFTNAVPVVVGVNIDTSYIESWLGHYHLGTTAGTAFNAGQTTTMGRRPNGTLLWDGLIAEVIAYQRWLTIKECHQTVAYLARKWGITSHTTDWAAMAPEFG